MKILLVLALFVACAFAALTEQEYQTAFTNWMQKHQKSYMHDVFRARYQIWRQNFDYINDFNSKNIHMTLAMNGFGDLSNEEFKNIYLGLKVPAGLIPETVVAKPAEPTAATVDWRTKGAVTGIKNQGQCGSCWAFSTTGGAEGCHFLGKGQLVSLSEQNLMDCSWSQGDQGCDGGLMTQAYTYIINNGGIDTESTYPYTAESSQNCQYSATNKGSTVGSYVNVNQGDENDLQTKVTKGPTSVAIDASQSSFQFYSSGVYYEPACSSTQLDHGVLAVGYGVDSASGNNYWIVKNSWGTDWGMSGYIWMSKNRNNNCGIATMATLPTGCQ